MLRLVSKAVHPRKSVTVNSFQRTRNFSNSNCSYIAQILSGKELASNLKDQYRHEIKSLNLTPSLTIIKVGDRDDSSSYVNLKAKAANELGIDCKVINLPNDTTQLKMDKLINQLNQDDKVDGILVQLPLPSQLNEETIINSIKSEKDIDGFENFNVSELAKKNGKPLFKPCTPNGIIKLLKETKVDLVGKNAVVLGRSDIVGTPVANLLKNEDCTVTLCHSKSQNIESIIKNADILIVAIGKPQFVKGDWIKNDAIVIDVGINYLPDSNKKSGYKIVGDVEFESAKEKASFITPVPGGVGPMTISMLMENVLIASKRNKEQLLKYPIINPLPLKCLSPVPSDIDISRAQEPKLITQVAKELGIKDKYLEQYGHYKAKVSLDVYEDAKEKPNGKYVLVAGITPTPLGEGKSTTTMGIVQALGAHLNKPAIANVRQPSMGPTFGVKGGAAGGGYAQVIPMDEFNLHLTGDIHAIGVANNLLAAAIDTRMFHETTQKNDETFYKRLVPKKNGSRKFTKSMLKRLEKLGINKTNPDDLTTQEISKFAKLNIDPSTITIKRVVDVNDRFVREITIGQSPTEKGLIRKTGFDITVASEIMAILALSKDLTDLRQRVANVVIGSNFNGEPITVEDIGAAGAITALLKDTIKPNLMQTLEGTPVFVHAGPFANISIGASSVIADRMALKLVGENGFVVTEAGFDFTMGGERFINIKCRASGLRPDVIVLVATTRALKLHGGATDVKPGQVLPEEYVTENIELVKNGASTNLAKQIQNAKSYGSPVVVAINKFATDTPAEIEAIREEAIKAGAYDAVASDHWAKGGAGAIDLAKTVDIAAREAERDDQLNFLYDLEGSLEDRMRTITQKMYGAADIELSDLAKEQIKRYEEQGFGNLPVCIAKTQYSLSHDATLKGVPTGFTFPIREVRISAGAGYLYALAGKIMTIPGLSTKSGFMDVEVEDGKIEGLF